ncbi:hypothetical protein HOP50_03g25460 [Chloropicon primus]|uniref:Uncharacterized protein n=1 Tax=Chloropicon primus TaxID=1764295 RepID=A0A5B8MHW4_9CHLO|nr:hypothetical protein A3770_03p25450 [Chloropicon primus]UPQ99239.1 hypothetical protein HOP50_03g25460 [Chloropicon primus]|eukprot:QDZ20027.1 hypothetical protein A3770_03p25450 [Chloropicon primus]
MVVSGVAPPRRHSSGGVPAPLALATTSRSEDLFASASTPTSPDSPDSLGLKTGTTGGKKHGKMGKLWSTVKQNTKQLLQTPHSIHTNRRRSVNDKAVASLTPRNLNFGDGAAQGGSGSGSGHGGLDGLDGASLRLDGLDAKSLQRKRAEIERLKHQASQQLQRELLKHQKQLIVTSEMIADLHKTLGALRKCVALMKSTLPTYETLKSGLNLEEVAANDAEAEARSSGSQGASTSCDARGRRTGAGTGPQDLRILCTVVDQDLSRIIECLRDLGREEEERERQKRAARQAESQKKSKGRRRSSVTLAAAGAASLPAAIGAPGGEGEEERDSLALKLEKVQGRILGFASSVLEDENSSREEVELAVVCVSLASSPAQARRLLLQRHTRTLERTSENFRDGCRADSREALMPTAGAYLSTFLSVLLGAARDCEEYFGKTSGDNRWSSDYMCWCMGETQAFCAGIQKRVLSFVSMGGELRKVAEFVCLALVEAALAGKGAKISLVTAMQDKLTSMLMAAIGVYVPRVGQDVALQATAEIAQFAQLLEDGEQQVTFLHNVGHDSEASKPLFNSLSGSTEMISNTVSSLLEDVAPMLSPSIQACISSRMFFLFKQFMTTVGDSMRRYSSFISREAKENKVELLQKKKEEILENIGKAADKILEVRVGPGLREEIREKVEEFARMYSEIFCLTDEKEK